MGGDEVCNPLEEPGDVQAGHDEHHGKQQDDGGEIDAAHALRGAENPETKHQRRADDGHSGPINLGSGEAAKRKSQITGDEDGPRDREGSVRAHAERRYSSRIECLPTNYNRYAETRTANETMGADSFLCYNIQRDVAHREHYAAR